MEAVRHCGWMLSSKMKQRYSSISHMLNDVILSGKGTDKCRRKRRLWKMASICSAHHYSAERSQLLRWIQGRTDHWSQQSRYLCWGRIWEDLQEKWTRACRGGVNAVRLFTFPAWMARREEGWGLVTGREDLIPPFTNVGITPIFSENGR